EIYANVPLGLITMPCGAFPAISPAPTACRSTRTRLLGPAARGALMVGIPAPSTVRRATISEFWITIQASEPSGRQAIATGFVKNSVGAGVVARFTPWFRLSGACRRTFGSVWPAIVSSRFDVSKTETKPCNIELKRSGPLGDAPVLTTYALERVGCNAMAANWLGKAPVGVEKVCGFVEGALGTWPGPGASRPLELKPVL